MRTNNELEMAWNEPFVRYVKIRLTEVTKEKHRRPVRIVADLNGIRNEIQLSPGIA
jgi:hypothetical protein